MTYDIMGIEKCQARLAIEHKQRMIARQEERHSDALGSLALSRDLANDTIRIALNIIGINPNGLNQFERASAMLDMAQELAALTTIRVPVEWANGRGYNGRTV